MILYDFVANYDSQTKVKIIQKEDVLFEGSIDPLEKLLKAKVCKHGCLNDNGELVITVAEYV